MQTEKRDASFPTRKFWGFQVPWTPVRLFLKSQSGKLHSAFCYLLAACSSLVFQGILLLLRARERHDRAKGSTDNIKRKAGEAEKYCFILSLQRLFILWGLDCFTLHFTLELQEFFSTSHPMGMAQCRSSLGLNQTIKPTWQPREECCNIQF